jgi:hypothetical protein
MRVKVTVYYGDEGKPLTEETKEHPLVTEEEDEDSYQEAKDHLTEMILEPYQTDGFDLEDDEDEDAVGTDYLMAWVLPEWFETKQEAREFLDQIIEDIDATLADLE